MAKEPVPPEREAAEQSRPVQIRVAVYDDVGGSSSKRGLANCRGAAHFESCLRRGAARVGEFKCKRLSGADIANGALAKGRFHVLIQPGGEGVAQGRQLGEEGMENIRAFISNGGGYVGVCAGNNLASSDPNYMPYSLGLVNTQTLDSVPEYPFVKNLRGTATADFDFTSLGKRIFNTDMAGCKGVVYANGPLIMKGAPNHVDPLRSGFKVLATYTSEVNVTEYGREVKGRGEYWQMKGKPAAIAAPYGSGRVLCMSPHPEKPRGPNWMIRNAVRWVAGQGPDVEFTRTYQPPLAVERPLPSRKSPPHMAMLRPAAELPPAVHTTDCGSEDSADDDDVLDSPVHSEEASRRSSRTTLGDAEEREPVKPVRVIAPQHRHNPTVIAAARRLPAEASAGKRVIPRVASITLDEGRKRAPSFGTVYRGGPAALRRGDSAGLRKRQATPKTPPLKSLPGGSRDQRSSAREQCLRPSNHPTSYPLIGDPHIRPRLPKPLGHVDARSAAKATQGIPTTPPIAPKDSGLLMVGSRSPTGALLMR